MNSEETTKGAGNEDAAVAPNASAEAPIDDIESGKTEPTPANLTIVKAIDTSRSYRRKVSGSRRASTTEERRNPFAERDGNALIWKDLNMTVVISLTLYIC